MTVLDTETVTLSFAGGWIIAVIGAMLWLNKQFASMKDFVQKKIEQVLDKLSYHERHDDQRFAQMTNEMWQIRLDSALKDKTVAQKKEIYDFRRAPAESSTS